jgi:vacuolar-type H+-ATPase subunit H
MDNSNYGQAPQKRVERYDVISNINDMIETLRAASGVPFSSNCAGDRNDMIASLEELKNHLPASIAQSNDIVVRAQEIITTAREKSKKIIDEANRQYASKVNDHEITKGARDEADNILAAAENQADELRKSAHIYVKQLLTDANNSLSESIAKIQTNLSEIDTTLDSM